ncbi:M14 family zinc carboxypeptidase [Pseudalkalibacillus hwajinpoensis]|uniref:Carboxypeptidase n=1 Tax=Guptibacillus hwajinpoensis TaxID=208199 RepID=A0A4U1MJM4_9BACL|nr:M14 family zinc carboxypeptidase [Pseudalkalibacillus hwajinpoensis]TKD70775.1 carboxypeptidase [Pseudalkalibacillus hwajinpoensis]
MKKKILTLSLSAVIASLTIAGMPSFAAGNGPDVNGKETVQTAMLTTYEEMSSFLLKENEKQESMDLEVIGKTTKGRDIFLVKYITNPENPTILYLTQQHGNEALTTEGALDYIRHLGSNSKSNKELLQNVNILIVPMYNADGAMGDVDFELENYLASGRHLTRYNADKLDLNRDHVNKTASETKALHENVLAKYNIDYMIDFHHQGTQEEYDGKPTSGSLLTPQIKGVKQDVVEQSKRLATVLYQGLEAKGWSHVFKYDEPTENPNVASNAMALQYDIGVILFEMRGMADGNYEPYVLGQKSNGYLTKQAFLAIDSTANAIANRSINQADVSVYDNLPDQLYNY